MAPRTYSVTDSTCAFEAFSLSSNLSGSTINMTYIKDNPLSVERNKNYQRAWYLKNKDKQKAKIKARRKELSVEIRKLVREVKQEASCADCGYSNAEFPETLDFDHLGDKKFGLGNAATSAYSIETVRKEMSKCEIVCAICHRIRTAKRKKHGNIV